MANWKNPFKSFASDLWYDAKQAAGMAKDACVDAYKSAKSSVKSAVNWVDDNVVEPVSDFVDDNVVEPVKEAAEWADDKLDYIRPASKKDVEKLQGQLDEVTAERDKLKQNAGVDAADTVTNGSYSDTKAAIADTLGTESAANFAENVVAKGSTGSTRRLPGVAGSALAVATKAADIVKGATRQLPQGAADIMAKSELGYGDSELQAE